MGLFLLECYKLIAYLNILLLTRSFVIEHQLSQFLRQKMNGPCMQTWNERMKTNVVLRCDHYWIQMIVWLLTHILPECENQKILSHFYANTRILGKDHFIFEGRDCQIRKKSCTASGEEIKIVHSDTQ